MFNYIEERVVSDYSWKSVEDSLPPFDKLVLLLYKNAEYPVLGTLQKSPVARKDTNSWRHHEVGIGAFVDKDVLYWAEILPLPKVS
jgi:hypothetical protein